jgi:2-polyprenyl-3-methyl-5-hydroxy-6-metoxy-1,4-benzoquinol methylase
MPVTDYRTRIYAAYSTRFKSSDLKFDPQAASHWGMAYKYYLRGWLPADPKARIVDLACGNGYLLYQFKQLGYSDVGGVDISPEQVRIARQVTDQITEGSLFDFLKNHENDFDLITGIDIVEHMNKDEVLRFLDACLRALKPGGRLILQTPNADSPMVNGIRYGDFTHETIFSPQLLSNLLGLCGFARTESREMDPPPKRTPKSILRRFAWKLIRCGIWFWNMVEMGNAGSRVYSRVFLLSGIKGD